MLLMIDNYDSFTYNVVQYLGELGAEVEVHRNDEITLAEIEAKDPEMIVVSPGPCTPNEAGISMDVVRTFGPHILSLRGTPSAVWTIARLIVRLTPIRTTPSIGNHVSQTPRPKVGVRFERFAPPLSPTFVSISWFQAFEPAPNTYRGS